MESNKEKHLHKPWEGGRFPNCCAWKKDLILYFGGWKRPVLVVGSALSDFQFSDYHGSRGSMVGKSKKRHKRSGNFSWSKCHVNLWKLVYQCTLSCWFFEMWSLVFFDRLFWFWVYIDTLYTVYAIYLPCTSHIAVSMFWLSVGTPYLPPTDRWHQLPGASPTHRYSLGTLDFRFSDQ